MSIEFFCNGCQQRLAVPDENAGKKAKCPSCGAVLDVPAVSVGRPSAVPPISPFGSAGQPQVNQPDGGAPNPYAAPSSVSDFGPSPAGEMSRQVIDPGYALTTAWELFKRNAAVLIGAYVIQVAASFGTSSVESKLVSLIFGNLLQAWLTIGLLRITFAVARYQPADIGMLFSGGRYLLRYVGASIIFIVSLILGLILLVIPGIYILLTYWPYIYFIVDRDCGMFESLSLAGEYTPGNRLNCVLLLMMTFSLFVIGMLVCLVGWLVTMPIAMMMTTISYLMMTGQPFSQPR